MIVLAAVATMLCGSCTDHQPTAAADGARLDAAVASAVEVTGCTIVQVRLSGRDEASLRADTSETCGPIRPVVSGAARFDRAHGTLALPIALRNTGQRKVKVPARLYAWEDSATVTDPPGLAQNRHTAGYVTLIGADSTVAADAAELAGASIWAYDSLLAATNTSQTLNAGQESRVRWIELHVQDGVHALKLVLHASARRASPPVPPVAPDTVPAFIYDSANVAVNPPEFSGRILRDIVVLEFQENTPQEARQAAVDMVDGEVVGGWQFGVGEGWYAVRVPTGGSTARLFEAIHRLSDLPQVVVAGPESLDGGELGYIRPEDGPRFTGYSLDPARAEDWRWGLERIAAPMAWGCATGDSTLAIAVADAGFGLPTDLAPNVNTNLSAGIDAPGDPTTHGTSVASVIAAVGNNHRDMTGLLWRANVRMYNVFTDSATGAWHPTQSTAAGLQRFTLAAKRGARVINYSLFEHWDHTPSAQVPGDTARVNWTARAGKARLRAMANAGLHPLIVLISGNDSLPVEWNGMSRWKEADTSRVLVVGAAERTLFAPYVELASFSNRGPLVDVVAPGYRVGVLTRADTLAAGSGTSFAAPYVTGLAGLLMSFDPTLADRPDEVRRLILQGAARGGVVVGNGTGPSRFMINAYESLKLAARRRGAPICGNRIWTVADKIIIQRDTVPGAVPDTLSPSFLPSAVDVMHGGRRIRVRDLAGGERDFTYQNGQWVRGAWLQPGTFDTFVAGSGASYLSAGDVYSFKSPRTHDGDTIFNLQSNGDPSSVTLSRFTGGTLTTLVSMEGSSPREHMGACIWARYTPDRTSDGQGCVLLTDSTTTYDRGDWTFGVLPAPNDSLGAGAKLVMALKRTTISQQFNAWTVDGCPKLPVPTNDGSPSKDSLVMECRSWTIHQVSHETRFMVLNDGGQTVGEWTVPGNIDLSALSEDGHRALVKLWNEESLFEAHMIAPYSARGKQVSYTGSCVVQERSLAARTVFWTGPDCRTTSVSPVFGPDRIPAVQTQLSHARERLQRPQPTYGVPASVWLVTAFALASV